MSYSDKNKIYKSRLENFSGIYDSKIDSIKIIDSKIQIKFHHLVGFGTIELDNKSLKGYNIILVKKEKRVKKVSV